MVEAKVLGDVGYRIRGITEVTRQKVQRAITDGLDDGLGARDLGQLVERSAAFAPYRAEVIARTETNRVLNVSQIASFKEYGVTHVEAIDGDDDDECRSRNGRVYTVEQAAGIEDHPNGTLDWSPVVLTGYTAGLDTAAAQAVARKLEP